MPQLDILTYVAQFSWFVILFNLFYFFTLYNGLPKLFTILKTRKKLTTVIDQGSDSTVPATANTTTVETPSSELLNEAVRNAEQVLRDASNNSKSWVQSTIVNLNKTALKKFNTTYLREVALKQGKIFCFNAAASPRHVTKNLKGFTNTNIKKGSGSSGSSMFGKSTGTPIKGKSTTATSKVTIKPTTVKPTVTVNTSVNKVQPSSSSTKNQKR